MLRVPIALVRSAVARVQSRMDTACGKAGGKNNGGKPWSGPACAARLLERVPLRAHVLSLVRKRRTTRVHQTVRGRRIRSVEAPNSLPRSKLKKSGVYSGVQVSAPGESGLV